MSTIDPELQRLHAFLIASQQDDAAGKPDTLWLYSSMLVWRHPDFDPGAGTMGYFDVNAPKEKEIRL
jgi:hypothetical protein